MTGTTLFRIDVSGAQNEFTIHSYKMISPFTHTTKLLHCKKAIFYYKWLFTESHVCPIMLFVHRFR